MLERRLQNPRNVGLKSEFLKRAQEQILSKNWTLIGPLEEMYEHFNQTPQPKNQEHIILPLMLVQDESKLTNTGKLRLCLSAEPENTLLSFRKALEGGLKAIEVVLSGAPSEPNRHEERAEIANCYGG